jgi:1-acyl-sn-glycerol-3-phosphate acyltransferase
MLYRLLKILIGVGMHLYYREIRVKNRSFLQHDGPVIIIANHPNTLMDAWLIALACKKPIHYLAKGTFFNTKLKRRILGSLGMIPINRQIDGNTTGVSNTSSFEACYKVLEAGKILVIFPEGNSIMERQLRELKSGTARIALEVLKRNEGNIDLMVVPLGLYYSQAHRFRSSVFVNFGKGISVHHHLANYLVNPTQAARELTKEFRTLLEGVLVLSASKEQESLVDDLYEILYGDEEHVDVEKKAKLMLELHSALEKIQLDEPQKMESVQQLVNSFKWQTEQIEIRSEFIEKGLRSTRFVYELMLSIVFFIIGLPMFLFGFIHSIIPFKTTDLLMPKLVKNLEYYAPIAILLGLVLYPVNYFLLLNVATKVFDLNFFMKVVYFVLMPLTGMYAFHFTRFLSSVSFRFKFLFLLSNNKDVLKSLKEKKESLARILKAD